MRYEGKQLPAWVRLRPRKPQQPLPPLSELVQSVLRNRSGALAEQVTRNNALLARLRAMSNRE